MSPEVDSAGLEACGPGFDSIWTESFVFHYSC